VLSTKPDTAYKLSGDGISGLQTETIAQSRHRNASARFRMWNLLVNFFVVPNLEMQWKLVLADDLLALLALDRAAFPQGTRLRVGKAFVHEVLQTLVDLEKNEAILDQRSLLPFSSPGRTREKKNLNDPASSSMDRRGQLRGSYAKVLSADTPLARSCADRLETSLLQLCTWLFRAFPPQDLFQLAFR
ncbi:unnamed protein product, partial [Amoebophrya sp. A120]